MDSPHRAETTMADETDVATREAKEAFIDSKMEKIRQRNRELQQRYLEIEADKQNAEENSNAALAKQLAQDGTVEKMPQRIAKSTTPKARKIKPDSSSGGNIQGPSPPSANANDLSRRQQRLSEDENPPPDPSYNFLFDRLRVGNESDEQRIQSRRHPSNYGGQDFSNVKNTMQIRKRHEREHPRGPPRTKMEMTLTMTGHERTQYEEWKRVQDQCDKERLARQKTASGEWRREWDRDKIIQDDDNDVWRRPNGPRGGGGGGGSGGGGGGGGGDHRGGRGGNRGCLFARGGRDRGRGGRGGNNGGEMSPFPSRGGRGRGRGPRRPPANKRYSDSSSDADMARSPTDRKVNIGRDFLQIRVNNEFVPSSETQSNQQQQQQQQQFPETRPAQQRPRRVGSGRVLSASSQSEDEKGVEDQYSPRSEAIKEGVDEVKVIMKMDDLGKETEGSVDESVGDESWEDLTTSGNESQDLSCPTDDGNEKDEVESVKEIDEVFDEVVDKTDENVKVKEGKSIIVETVSSLPEGNSINVETVASLPEGNSINVETVSSLPEENSINVETVSSLPEENGISVGVDDLKKKNDEKLDEVVIENSSEITDVKMEPDNVMKDENLEENDAQIMSEVAEKVSEDVSDVEIESKLMEKTEIQSKIEENDAQIESKTKENNPQFVSEIVENNSQFESKIVENNTKIESEKVENNTKIESEIVENNSKIESKMVENDVAIEFKMTGSDSVDEENKPEAKSTMYENNDSKQELKIEENHSEEPTNLEKPSNEISIEAVASKDNESFKVTNDKMDHDDKTDSIDATNASIEVEKLE